MHVMKILCVRRRILFSVQCLEKELWNHCSLKRKFTAKNYQNIVAEVFAQLEEDERYCSLHKDLANAQTVKATTDFMQDFLGDGFVRSGFWPP
jgi:hypothetical protein